MGIHVMATYGRTETSGIVTSRNMFDYSNDAHLGAPVGCNEIKLLDDPEGRYTSGDQSNPRGEVHYRFISIGNRLARIHDLRAFCSLLMRDVFMLLVCIDSYSRS